MPADELGGVGLGALVPRHLGFRRALLDEPHREENEQRELQVLRLPGSARDLGMPRLEVVVVVPASDGLAAEGGQEEREEDEREALLAQETPHQWCVSPITVK